MIYLVSENYIFMDFFAVKVDGSDVNPEYCLSICFFVVFLFNFIIFAKHITNMHKYRH